MSAVSEHNEHNININYSVCDNRSQNTSKVINLI